MKRDRRAVSKVSRREKEESVTTVKPREDKKNFTAKLGKKSFEEGRTGTF